MKTFRCKVIGDKLKILTIRANSKKEAIAQLRKHKLNIIYVIRWFSDEFFSTEALFGTQLKDSHITEFLSTIAIMSKSNINILEIIHMLSTTMSDSAQVRAVSKRIYQELQAGKSLSEACTMSSKSFDANIISILKVCEKIGTYHEPIEHVVKYIKWKNDVNKQVKKAMSGPIATLFLLFGMIIAIVKFVIPTFVTFLNELGTKQNKSMDFMIKMSTFASDYSKEINIFIGIVLSLIIASYVAPLRIKIIIDKFKLKMPIFGTLFTKIDCMNFSSFFSMMQKNNVDILESLLMARNTIKNNYLKNQITQMHKQIQEGMSFQESIDKRTAFPIFFRKMTLIGLEANMLDFTMDNVVEKYNIEIYDKIAMVTGLIKPTLLFVGAGMLMLIISAVMTPMYESISKVLG